MTKNDKTPERCLYRKKDIRRDYTHGGEIVKVRISPGGRQSDIPEVYPWKPYYDR
jgi:hypothetical protein